MDIVQLHALTNQWMLNIFYIIQGNDATPDSLLNDAAERIITLTVKYCGGSGRIIKPEVT